MFQFYNRLVFVALLAALFLWLCASPVIINKYTLNQNISELVIDIILAYEFIFIFIFALTFRRLVFAIGFPVIFIISRLAGYFVLTYKVRIDSRTFGLLFETPASIQKQFISYDLLSIVVTALIISIICVVLFLRFDKGFKLNNHLKFCVYGFVVFAILLSKSVNQIMPYNILNSAVQYILKAHNVVSVVDISEFENNLISGDDDLVVMVILGESVRADHLHINGYHRQNTPKIEQIPNLVNFPDVTSCANLTIESKPCLLTRSDYQTFHELRETSFISIFRKLGFDTIWFDNPNMYQLTMTHFKLTGIMKEAEFIISRDYAFDSDYVPLMREYIDKSEGNILIVGDSKSGHWPYDIHYPEQYRKWLPVCKVSNVIDSRGWGYKQKEQMAACDNQSLINAYDNNILALDSYIKYLTEILSERNALLIYVSDHGESLGEDGFYLHGQGTIGQRPEQFHVAMMIWASDEYIRRNKEKFLNIKHNANKGIRHNSVFHTVLDCSNIESEVLDKSLSLCAKEFH